MYLCLYMWQKCTFTPRFCLPLLAAAVQQALNTVSLAYTWVRLQLSLYTNKGHSVTLIWSHVFFGQLTDLLFSPPLALVWSIQSPVRSIWILAVMYTIITHLANIALSTHWVSVIKLYVGLVEAILQQFSVVSLLSWPLWHFLCYFYVVIV